MDNSSLQRWRALDAADALQVLAEWAKEDQSFRERSANGTTRWHASVRGTDYELLCCGPKFYDTRQQSGGGGAVDLVKHLHGLTFKEAAKVLQKSGL